MNRFSAKKIGILSLNMYTKDLNYASRVHTYAFQQFLFQNGFDNVVIDYVPKHVSKDFDLRHPYDFYSAHPPKEVKAARDDPERWRVLYEERERKFDKIQSFIDEKYVKTSKRYTSKSLDKLDPGCDIYMPVTDVLWCSRPGSGFDETFFCKKPCMEGKGKVAYAVAHGGTPYTPEQLETVRELTADFDYVGCREKPLLDYYTDEFKRDAALVLDPVFLHEKEFYDDICSKPAEKNYVLLYTVMNDCRDLVRRAAEFAAEKGLELIEISDFYENADFPEGTHHAVKTDLGIEEWLGYIRNADYIITNSFHCCCFSIIFEKEFYGISSRPKVVNLLSLFGIKNRLIRKNEPLSEKRINFEKVGALREKYKELSSQWVLNALTQTCDRLVRGKKIGEVDQPKIEGIEEVSGLRPPTKKLGLLSLNFYTADLNYACRLHTYAFQSFLDSHGVNNTIIDYIPNHCNPRYDMRHPYDWIVEHPFADKERQKYELFRFKKLYAEREHRTDEFARFIREHCRKTYQTYTPDLIDRKDPGFDAYAPVTDVLWQYRPNGKGFDKAFFLESETLKKKGKLSYAVSVGGRNFTDDQFETLREYLSKFDYISVRESYPYNLLKDNTDLDPSLCLDPVFLQDRSFYDEISWEPEEKGYVLIYGVMKKFPSLLKQAAEFAAKKGLQLIELSGFPDDEDFPAGTHHKVLYDVNVEQWLGYIKNADCVFTNSFHCCCFSIIFGKEFFCGDRKGEKIHHLLNIFSLENRWLEKSDVPTDERINYSSVYSRLKKYRSASEDYFLAAVDTVFEKENDDETVRPLSGYERVLPEFGVSIGEKNFNDEANEKDKKLFGFIIDVVDNIAFDGLIESIDLSCSQIIVIDSKGILSEHPELLSDKNRNKVKLISRKAESLRQIYLVSCKHLNCEYVCFADNSFKYATGALKAARRKIEFTSCDALCLKPVYVHSNGNEDPYPVAPADSGTFEPVYQPGKMNFFLGSYFLRKKAVDEIGFKRKIENEQDKDFLIRFVLQNKRITAVDSKLYYRYAAENTFETNMIQHKKGWYLENIGGWIRSSLKGASKLGVGEKQFVLCCAFYLIAVRFHCNFNDRNKKALSDDEIETFFKTVGDVLALIPDEIILQHKKVGAFNLNRGLKFLLLNLKYKQLGQNYQIVDNGKQFFLYSPIDEVERIRYSLSVEGRHYLISSIDDSEIDDSLSLRSFNGNIQKLIQFDRSEYKYTNISQISTIANEKVGITAINYENGNLVFDARSFLVDVFGSEKIDIVVDVNGSYIEPEKVFCAPDIKCFGRVINQKYQFRFSVPVDLAQQIKISILLSRNGKRYPQALAFTDFASRLNNTFGRSYWQFDKGRTLHCLGGKTLVVTNGLPGWKLLYKEYMLQREMRTYMQSKGLWEKDKDWLKLRKDYFRLRNKKENSNIWVSFDKLYKGGDNGEYMFHYLDENNTGVKPYYIINEDSDDYKRLSSRHKNILTTNSFECRLKCLLAKAVLATHSTIWGYCGFDANNRKYVSDLLNARLVCIQHGLTVQKIEKYQNRLFDNTQFYCCASKYEVQNILQPSFGYDKDRVVLTGLARFDGLKNRDQKIILITPTWRRDIVNNSIAYIKKTHNNHFKESTYFNIYNSLINDKKLIEKAKEKGYRIIFLLHPAMSAQSVDYDRNDYVEIVEATSDISYEKILTESSLMVTDYSGVQFDFAYQRKPIVYYHPSKLPPFYEESVYKYETMAFGEICTEHEELVNMVCEYIDNDCRCKDKFIARADDFFAFNDFNSCSRIHGAISEFLKK